MPGPRSRVETWGPVEGPAEGAGVEMALMLFRSGKSLPTSAISLRGRVLSPICSHDGTLGRETGRVGLFASCREGSGFNAWGEVRYCISCRHL
jgi:hypothetical protein